MRDSSLRLIHVPFLRSSGFGTHVELARNGHPFKYLRGTERMMLVDPVLS